MGAAVSNLPRNAGKLIRSRLRDDFLRGVEVENLTRPVLAQVIDVGDLQMADIADVQALGQPLLHDLHKLATHKR